MRPVKTPMLDTTCPTRMRYKVVRFEVCAEIAYARGAEYTTPMEGRMAAGRNDVIGCDCLCHLYTTRKPATTASASLPTV